MCRGFELEDFEEVIEEALRMVFFLDDFVHSHEVTPGETRGRFAFCVGGGKDALGGDAREDGEAAANAHDCDRLSSDGDRFTGTSSGGAGVL